VAYGWLTFVAARQQLSARLADPQQAQWSDLECGLYIQEALRMWNVFTNTWVSEYAFNPSAAWVSLATTPASPRTRTLTDVQMYTLLQFHLLEPASGGVWTGTSQFNLADLSGALQRRRDEMIQVSNCNQTISTLASSINQRRIALPDTVLEPQRIRFLPVQPPVGKAPPITLVRDDRLGFEYFEPDFYQEASALPSAWMVSAEPPLAVDVDIPPSVAGVYELLSLQSGTPFNPPAPTLIGVPDDFGWLARWGALADLLGRESEATDRARAEWCQKRYVDGLKLLANTPWVYLAMLDGQGVDVVAMTDMDRYQPEWDSDPTLSDAVVIAGVDMLWVPPGYAVQLTLLGNAPIPVVDADFIQASRSAWDACLSMAQFLATFKLGGAEFQQAAGLESQFIQAAAAENNRLEELGLFADVLSKRATAEDRVQERYVQS
jgi:hypothetical protein